MQDYFKLLGFRARDKVTKFEGVVSSLCFDLYGCVQCALTPEVKDGKIGEGHWFDAKRLQITSEAPVMAAPEFATLQAGDEKGPAEKPRFAEGPAR